MKCQHDLPDREVAIVMDNMCPICLAVDKFELLSLLQEIFDEGEGGSLRSGINEILVRMR